MLNDPYFRGRLFGDRFDYIEESDRYYVPAEDAGLRVNVIGCGMVGQEHIYVTHLEGRARVHGVYDINRRSVDAAVRAHAQYAHHNLRIYPSLEEACADPQVDGLIIATPNHTHLQVMQSVIRSGKSILLEKPMATTVQDAAAIMNMANGYANDVQIGLQYRYKAIYREAYRAAVQDGRLGTLRSMVIMEHRLPFLDKVEQWNKFSAQSGGTLVEKCCHHFDLFNYFARSRPIRVRGIGSMAVNFKDMQYKGQRPDIMDNAAILIEYENGMHGVFHLCMFAPLFSEEIIMLGDAGRLRAEMVEDYLPGQSIKTSLEIQAANRDPSMRMEPHYHRIIEESGHGGGTYFAHAAFVDRLLGIDVPAPTPMEGLWSVIVGAAAEEAVRSQQPVDINDMLKQAGIAHTLI